MTTTTDVRPARATHFRLAVLALAVGGFAIGTTEFVTMGLLPQISEGVGVSIPQAGHIICRLRTRRRGRSAGAGVLRREVAATGAAGRADGRLRPLQRPQRGRVELRDAGRRPVPRRVAARRVLRRRVPGRRQHGRARAARSGDRVGVAGPPCRQRDRCPCRDRARPAPRVAGVVLAGGGPGRADDGPGRGCSCRPARATPRRPDGASCRRSGSRRSGSRWWPAPSGSAACSPCTPTSRRPSPR